MPTEEDIALLDPSRDAKRVKIGGITLGIRRDDNPDTSIPNPLTINWSQEFGIAEEPVTGEKPVTIVTQPDALWRCSIELNTLDNRDEVLDLIEGLDVGPMKVTDYLHSKCMLLKKKDITQRKGSKDYYHNVKLEFVENNPGVA